MSACGRSAGETSKRKYLQAAKRGSLRAMCASAALCSVGLIECLIGWPRTASAVPSNDQFSRSASVSTELGSDIFLRSSNSLSRAEREQRSGNEKAETKNFSVRVSLVSCVKLFDETGKKPGVLEIAGRLVMVHQVATAPAKDLANRGRRKVRALGHDFIRAQQSEYLIRIQKDTAIEGIDEKRLGRAETADHEMTGQTNGLQVEPKSICDQQI